MGFKEFSANTNNDVQNGKKVVEEYYNMYKGKSENELLDELHKHVAKQKQDGTFNIDALSNMLNKLSPFLSEEQRLKMEEILKNL